MEAKLQGFVQGLRKAIICLAFLGFLVARDARAYPPPVLLVQPLGITVYNGDSVVFVWLFGVSQTPLTPTLLLDGGPIKNPCVDLSTNLDLGIIYYTFTIKNASQSKGGSYALKLQNSGGVVTSGKTLLTVLTGTSSGLTNVGILTSQCFKTNGGFKLQMIKPATSNCVLDASTDIAHWTPIYTNTSGSTNFSYLDPSATNRVLQYYRVRMQ